MQPVLRRLSPHGVKAIQRGESVSQLPSERPRESPMSPAQAAQSKDVSRRTIMRAIEAHKLKAIRDNRNRWKIDPQELDRWADAQWAPSESVHSDVPIVPTPCLEVRLAVAEAERDAFKAQLIGVEEDRDRWRKMAERLSDKPRWSWPWWR